MFKSVLLTVVLALSMAACAPKGEVTTSATGAIESLGTNNSMTQENQVAAQEIAQELGNPELSVTPVQGNANAINLNIAGMNLPVEFINDGKFAVSIGGIPLTMADLNDKAKMEGIIFQLLFNSGQQKSVTAQPKIFESLLPIFYRLIIDALISFVSSQIGVVIPNPISTPTTPTLPTTGNVLFDSVFQLIGGLFKN